MCQLVHLFQVWFTDSEKGQSSQQIYPLTGMARCPDYSYIPGFEGVFILLEFSLFG